MPWRLQETQEKAQEKPDHKVPRRSEASEDLSDAEKRTRRNTGISKEGDIHFRGPRKVCDLPGFVGWVEQKSYSGGGKWRHDSKQLSGPDEGSQPGNRLCKPKDGVWALPYTQ